MSSQSNNPPRVHLRVLERVIRIHKQIDSGCFPDCNSLAKLLERDVRTVKRDIAEMRHTYRAPIKYSRAKRGFYYAELGWQPPLVRLTEGDLLAFFTAEYALKCMGHTPEAALLRSSVTKFAAYLPDEISINLGNLGAALSYESSPHTTVEPETLKILAKAAGERRTVEFDYYSQHRGAQTHRRADVLLLHNFAGDWYAISFDHLSNEMRDFHIGRISRLRLTSNYFVPPDHWNKDEYLKRGFLMVRGGRLTQVSIVFDSYQSQWMRERRMFHAEETREELPDGSLRLSFPVGTNGLEAVARFCLAYAGHVQVERPIALRKLFRERLIDALEHHTGD